MVDAAIGGVFSVDCKEVYIFSMHLAPFKENAASRAIQLDSIMRVVGTSLVIIAGDANIREQESQSFLKKYNVKDTVRLKRKQIHMEL